MITNTIGWVHLAASILALLSGTLVLLRTKGDYLHKVSGYIYTIAMMALIITAFMIYDLFGGLGPFHFAALVSFFTLLRGLIPVWRKKHDWYLSHYYGMSWSVVGLYAAFVAEVGVRLVPFGAFWIAVFGTLLLVTAGGAWIIQKNSPAKAKTLSIK